MELPSNLWIIASFAITTILLQGASALQYVHITVPKFARRGSDVHLTCKYDTDVGMVYAVKWYKGLKEFYRFVPKEVPPVQVFPLPGVHVEVSKSDEHNVVLSDVPLEISGLFKCVVSAETTFETLTAQDQLTVVVIGDDRPSVELDRTEYGPGDFIHAQCHTPPSYPAANVTWYLDDTKMNDLLTKTEIQRWGIDPVVTITHSNISFRLPGPMSPGPYCLKCRATVYTAYDKTAAVTIEPTQRISNPHTLLHSGTCRVKSQFVIFTLNLYIFTTVRQLFSETYTWY